MTKSFLPFAFALVPLLALADTTTGCFVAGGNCDCSPQGVIVQFPASITSDQVASVTGTGDVCGPAPKSLCESDQTYCTTSDQSRWGWSVLLPSRVAGECSVKVVLKNGKTIEGSSTVVESTGGCCAGLGGGTIVLKS